MTLRIGFDPTQCAFAHGLGSPLPGVASPSIALIYSSRTASHIIIYSSKPHRTYIFQQNSIANIYIFQPNGIARIYSSRTASYVRIRTLGVATTGSGGPSPRTQHVESVYWGCSDISIEGAMDGDLGELGDVPQN